MKDIFLSGAAAITAYVAYTGLGKWQKELRGRASFEVARTLIKSVYKLRDELGYCRSPFILQNEFPEWYTGTLGNHTNEEEGRAWAHVYSARLKHVGEATQYFDTAMLEAEALWGVNIKEKAQPLRQATRTLQVHIQALIDDKFSGGEDFRDRDFANKVRSSVSDTKPEDNQLTIKINDAIHKLETETRLHLSRN